MASRRPSATGTTSRASTLKGKILVVLVNDPDFEGGEGDFGGKAMTYYGRWTYKYEEAARQGALGVLVIHETDAGLLRLGDGQELQHQRDVRHRPRRIPAPSMRRWRAGSSATSPRQLFAASGPDFEADEGSGQAQATSSRSPLKARARHPTSTPSPRSSRRTMSSGCCRARRARTRRSSTPRHWDHLGIGLPDANGDRIYNGASTTRTGIAQLIEQARAFAAGPRPQRSMVFMAVTAEEKGLLGSEYYAANPLYSAAKTAGVINTDVLGVLGPARDFTIRGNQKFGLLDILVEEGAKRGRRYTPDPRPETGGFFRSDHFTLAKTGIPAMSFGPGQDLINGGVARAKAWQENYTTKMYHQPDDEYSPDWDFTGMAEDAELLHAVGLRLANSNAWPNWSSDSEFRAARDRTAAERGETAAPSAPPPPKKKGERG